MSIGGGNTAEDPIKRRDLAAANERGEGEYRNKRRKEKHLGAGRKRPSILRALYCEPGPATEKLSLVGLCMKRVLRRPYMNVKSTRLLHRRAIAQLLIHFTWAPDEPESQDYEQRGRLWFVLKGI